LRERKKEDRKNGRKKKRLQGKLSISLEIPTELSMYLSQRREFSISPLISFSSGDWGLCALCVLSVFCTKP